MPSADGKLTDDDQTKIAAALHDKGIRGTCSLCNSKQSCVLEPQLVWLLELPKGRSSYPNVPIICKNCGHTRLFNIATLASALWTAAPCLRWLEATEPPTVEFSEWSRLGEELWRGKPGPLGASDARQFWRYYPAAPRCRLATMSRHRGIARIRRSGFKAVLGTVGVVSENLAMTS